jgi:hypothetical protein
MLYSLNRRDYSVPALQAVPLFAVTHVTLWSHAVRKLHYTSRMCRMLRSGMRSSGQGQLYLIGYAGFVERRLLPRTSKERDKADGETGLKRHVNRRLML